jgi:Ni,Fe-hydrogenase I large subunit
MSRVVVDPVTRIEGHLRIEAEVEGGKVRDAWSSSSMFRGIELILQGRDPRDAWAFTQRICGVCTTVHAIASIRAVENGRRRWRRRSPTGRCRARSTSPACAIA